MTKSVCNEKSSLPFNSSLNDKKWQYVPACLFVCQKVGKYEHIYQKRSNVTFDRELLSELLQEKVIYFRLGSLPSKIHLSLKKVSRDAGVRLCNLKRRRDFDQRILPARKVARFGAERVQAVSFSVVLLWLYI